MSNRYPINEVKRYPINEVAIEISSNNLINGIVHDVFGNTWGGTVLNNHPFGYGIIILILGKFVNQNVMSPKPDQSFFIISIISA